MSSPHDNDTVAIECPKDGVADDGQPVIGPPHGEAAGAGKCWSPLDSGDITYKSILKVLTCLWTPTKIEVLRRRDPEGWQFNPHDPEASPHTQYVMDGNSLFEVAYGVGRDEAVRCMQAEAAFSIEHDEGPAGAVAEYGRIGAAIRDKFGNPSAFAVLPDGAQFEANWEADWIRVRWALKFQNNDTALAELTAWPVSKDHLVQEAVEFMELADTPYDHSRLVEYVATGTVARDGSTTPRHFLTAQRDDGTYHSKYAEAFAAKMKIGNTVYPTHTMIRSDAEGEPLKATVVFDLVHPDDPLQHGYVVWKSLSENLAALYGPPTFTGGGEDPVWGMTGWEIDGCQVLVEFGSRVVGGLALSVFKPGVRGIVWPFEQILAKAAVS